MRFIVLLLILAAAILVGAACSAPPVPPAVQGDAETTTLAEVARGRVYRIVDKRTGNVCYLFRYGSSFRGTTMSCVQYKPQ